MNSKNLEKIFYHASKFPKKFYNENDLYFCYSVPLILTRIETKITIRILEIPIINHCYQFDYEPIVIYLTGSPSYWEGEI